jgi:tight adherence protein B
MNLLIVGIIIFFVSIALIELVTRVFGNSRVVKNAKVKKRLRKFVFVPKSDGTGDILKKREISGIPWFNSLLLKMSFINSMDRLIIQANTKYNLGFFILLSITIGLVGYLAAAFFLMTPLISVLIAFLLAAMPYLYLMSLKNRRMEKFREQLPEGLDLIARSLRAGHAFTSGMKMVTTEFDDPLGTELEEALDEINFGVNVTDALKNLADRIDAEEAKFFVTAVVLQRETGGNLAEILESLAKLIRKKFEFQDKVKTLTAEGRVSALVLVMLPFVIGTAIHILNPTFLSPLFTEPIGHLLLGIGGVLMIIGILVIRKMIEIKV